MEVFANLRPALCFQALADASSLKREVVEGLDGPVHLVGHSMGGYVSLLAACKKPGLAQSVTLVDSPVVGGWRAHALHMAKVTGLAPRVSPGHISAKRRERWPSRTASKV